MNENNDQKMAIAFIASFILLIVAFFVLPKAMNRNQAPIPTAAQAAAVTNVTAAASTNAAASTASAASEANPVRFTGAAAATNALVGSTNELQILVETRGARIDKVMMNGSWNRTGEPVVLETPSNSVEMSDFYFGSFDTLRSTADRPVYRIDSLTSNSVTLSAAVTFNNVPLRLTRTFEVSSNYIILDTLSIQNLSRTPLNLDDNGTAFTIAGVYQFTTRGRINNQNVSKYRYFDGRNLNEALKTGFFKAITHRQTTTETFPSPLWLSQADNYFVAIIKPLTNGFNGRYTTLVEEKNYREIAMALETPPFILDGNQTRTYKVSYYVGPRKEDLLKKIDPNYNKIFSWGVLFNWLMRPIAWLITKGMFLISKVIKNWGVVIMLLALIIKLLLSPLSIRAAISMKRTQMMQPKLKNLQDKYKDDQQALQQKTVELYRKEGINPLGGCWPMLLQIPVFFALYRVLSTSVELRGAKFLWIKDLTQPDTLFAMNVPLLPHQFNLLPIVMTIISLVQTYLQQGKNKVSATGQNQNALQMYMMPVLFLFLFWNMPAGLVLYWTIQNIYTIIEQEVINLDKKVVLK